jgi:hypothetical protein
MKLESIPYSSTNRLGRCIEEYGRTGRRFNCRQTNYLFAVRVDAWHGRADSSDVFASKSCQSNRAVATVGQ